MAPQGSARPKPDVAVARRREGHCPPWCDAVEQVGQPDSHGRRAAVKLALERIEAAVRCGLGDRRHEIREDVEDAAPRPEVGGSRGQVDEDRREGMDGCVAEGDRWQLRFEADDAARARASCGYAGTWWHGDLGAVG